MVHQVVKQNIDPKSLPLPEITYYQDDFQQGESYYKKIIQNNLRELINLDYSYCENEQQKIEFFKRSFPSVNWHYYDKKPYSLRIRCIYNHRLYSSKFIYDILSRWLIPGKRLNIISQFGSDFTFTGCPENRFIIVDMHLSIETTEDLKTIKQTMPMIASEVRVGVESIGQGLRILEIKGLNVDDKINLIQESIVSLISQKPQHFDHRLFSEMQRFFVFSEETFKEKREYRHLVRIICWQYLFRKSVLENRSLKAQRIIRIKLMKTRLHYPYGAKTVLGVLIGVSQIRENERFGQDQIERAIRASIPTAKLISGSFLSNKKSVEDGALLYAEFEKKDNQQFSYEELSKLRKNFSNNLLGSIEYLMNPIFMPRNEEEIMRNILNLSKQLKSYNDIPQLIISFDSQGEQHITFNLILLRVIKNDDLSVQNICANKGFKYEIIPDRIKIVGHIKRKYVKEANVFYVRLDKQSFFRKDYSLDLYKARQALLNELYRVFDDVRDYNGGMIAKENELFLELKERLKRRSVTFSDLVLENFFYGIHPVIARSLMEINVLETSFRLLLTLLEGALSQQDGVIVKFAYQDKYIFCFIASNNPNYEKTVNNKLSVLNLSRIQLIHTFLKVDNQMFLGYIFHSEGIEERKKFCDIIRQCAQHL